MTIYSLTASDEPEAIRYIGLTKRVLRKRLAEHIRQAQLLDFPVQRWMRKVFARGALVEAKVLEQLEGGGVEALGEAEKDWIQKMKAAGHDLMNLTAGGPGIDSPSQETREKLSRLHKGKPKSEAHREKLRAFQLAHPNSGSKGYKHTEADKAKFSRAGTKASLETRAKMSASRAGRVFSAETRAKIGAKSKGRFHSEASREKNRLAHLGKRRQNVRQDPTS